MFSLTSYIELNALLNSLLVLKFELPASDPDVRLCAGSTILERIIHAVYDAAIEASRSEGNEYHAKNLENRRLAGYRPSDIRMVRDHISFVEDLWATWDEEDRKCFVRTLISPFVPDDDFFASVLSEDNSDDN
jgi:hypothetical protein